MLVELLTITAETFFSLFFITGIFPLHGIVVPYIYSHFGKFLDQRWKLLTIKIKIFVFVNLGWSNMEFSVLFSKPDNNIIILTYVINRLSLRKVGNDIVNYRLINDMEANKFLKKHRYIIPKLWSYSCGP